MPFVRFCFFIGRNNHSRLPFCLCTELTFKKIPALISSGRKEKVIIRLWKYSRNGFRRMSESAVSIRRVSGVGISLKPGSCIMMRKMKTDRQTDRRTKTRNSAPPDAIASTSHLVELVSSWKCSSSGLEPRLHGMPFSACTYAIGAEKENMSAHSSGFSIPFVDQSPLLSTNAVLATALNRSVTASEMGERRLTPSGAFV